jgi:ABC-2 type transport system ATP-binding protein
VKTDGSAGENAIEIKNLTEDYGGGRGIFDVSITVKKAETVGYVGTNGSGKTTTIRHVMGFLKPHSGTVRVLGMDAWQDSFEIKKYVAYIPGEIAYPGVRTGEEFLRLQAEFYGMKDLSRIEKYSRLLQLDTSAPLRRMSKGMKQKTAIVAAFMADRPILILDEPTTGLDPLMREIFLDMVREEKSRGKTVFMSSQLFDEVESVCDRAYLLRDGKIIASDTLENIKNHGERTYAVAFGNAEDANAFASGKGYKIVSRDNLTVTVDTENGDYGAFFNNLDGKDVKTVTEKKYDFETYFDTAFRNAEGVKNDK